jgi:hypothetical protein
MVTWQEFAEAEPELAAFGAGRLAGQVAYLATVRRDGSPRVHPVTPLLAAGRLFLFMEPASPKGHDLRRDNRYALHCAVSDSSGSSGEFAVRGSAHLVEDVALREAAARAAEVTPKDRYILFELRVEEALSTVYREGKPVRQRWGWI